MAEDPNTHERKHFTWLSFNQFALLPVLRSLGYQLLSARCGSQLGLVGEQFRSSSSAWYLRAVYLRFSFKNHQNALTIPGRERSPLQSSSRAK